MRCHLDVRCEPELDAVSNAIEYAKFPSGYAISKKACGSDGVRVGDPSDHSDKTAKRGWHTDIDRRSLVWKF
jgi:hypothetical protein